jgi:hypothetical protein
MKNRFRLPTRLFTLFLAAQFLNVQIQSAYGTEAVISYSPEQQQLLRQIESRVLAKLGDRSEKKLQRVAYRLYKLNVKLRNQLASSEQPEQTEINLDQEDRKTIEVFSDDRQTPNTAANNAQVLNDLNEARKHANSNQILSQADSLLTALGSNIETDGRLSKASYSSFQDQLKQLKTNELRSPASAGNIILKVILSLLVLAGAMAALGGILLLMAVFIFAGGIIINFGVIVVLLGIAAIIVGMVFAIKKIFSINPPRRMGPVWAIQHYSPTAA